MLTDALSLAIRLTAAHRPPDAQIPDVILHINQRRITVLGRGRIGALNRQPITGGNDHRAELFDKVYRADA